MGVYEEVKKALEVELRRLDEKIDIAIQRGERLAFLEAKSLTR